VESAELLLIKQVEAEYQRNFEKETRQMVMKVAKKKAETNGQVEACLRHRVTLRNELCRILTELSDKLNQWHSKLCKKYSDSVSQLKRSKRQIEEKLGAAEQKLKYLAAKRESTQSSIENLLKPYASSISLDCQNLPGRDTLVSEIFRMVEKLEEPMISSVISTAVEKLISRSPEKKLEEVSKNMSKDQEGQPAMLDFASVQQMLQYTSAAQATDDLTPFLSESQKSPPLLLRGPDPLHLQDILREFREALVDRNSHASLKLLFSAESSLKILSKFKDEMKEDSVAAEVGLILAMTSFGAVTRVQQGCQLMATILNIRGLQLRKHALNRVLLEPFPSPTLENMNAQVRTIEATYRAIEGGITVLRNKGQSLARDAGSLLKLYGSQIDSLVQVTKRLAHKTHQAQPQVHGRRSSQETDCRIGATVRHAQESVAHLPALLAYQKSSSGSSIAKTMMIILRYQKVLLKLQLASRRWLRVACTPNLPPEQLIQTKDALQVMHKFLSRRLPGYVSSSSEDLAEDSSDSVQGESSESAQSPESPRRRAASLSSFFERGVSQATQNSEGTENVEIPIGPPKRRRWSDILHARPVTQQIVQLQQSFHEQLSLRKLEADSASSSSNVTPEPEVPQEAKEQRSKATFLNWTQAGQTRKDPKNKWKKGLALARSLKSKGKVVGKTAQKSGPGLAADSRVYVDLMGRQKVESEASEVHSEQSEGSEGSEGSESEGSGLSGVSEPELAPSTPATKRVLVPPAPLETVPRTPVANRTPRLVVGEAPSSPVTPTGEICRGRRLVSSTRVQRVQLEVKVEGVKVGRPVAEDVRNVLDDESCATSSEGVPEEGGDTPVAKMRTPTLVTRRSSSFPDMANPFLLLDDTVDLEDKVQKEPQSDDTKERSEKDAHPNPELSPRSPGSRGSPYRFVRSPSPAQSDSPHKGHSRQSGDSPGLSSPGQSMNTESTRWFLNVMEMEQRQAKLQAEKMPKTGRAFPSQNASYSCSGPPGTARRLQLHPRGSHSTSKPAMTAVSADEVNEVEEEMPEWGCPLPQEPGGAWKLLGSDQKDSNVNDQAAGAVEEDTAAGKEEEARIDTSEPQVVRVSSASFDSLLPRIPANQRGTRCIGRVRAVSSSSNWDLEPSPPSSSASEDETMQPMQPATDITLEEPEILEQEKRIPIQIGPLRYGLPMTRRGVVQLLPQNPGCMEPLELVGESVRKPSNRDYKIFKAARAQLSPDFELPSPVSQASVMECFERQPRLLLPVQATPDRPIQTEDATQNQTLEAPSTPTGVPITDVSFDSLMATLGVSPTRHSVTMSLQTMEDLTDLKGFLLPEVDGSFRPEADPSARTSLSMHARQAVMAAAAAADDFGKSSEELVSEVSANDPKALPSKASKELQPERHQSKESRKSSRPRRPATPENVASSTKWDGRKPRGSTIAELVATGASIPAPTAPEVQDHLKSWSMRPLSGHSHRGVKTSRPPFTNFVGKS